MDRNNLFNAVNLGEAGEGPHQSSPAGWPQLPCVLAHQNFKSLLQYLLRVLRELHGKKFLHRIHEPPLEAPGLADQFDLRADVQILPNFVGGESRRVGRQCQDEASPVSQ